MTTAYETILVETDARGVATVTLNRPDKHNALNGDLIAELYGAAVKLAADDTVRVVVLTGNGKSFCAGGDFNWFASNVEKSRAERVDQSATLARLLRRLDTLPKPLIGKINGPAYGGGVGIISVCDYTIGAEGARHLAGLTALTGGVSLKRTSLHYSRDSRSHAAVNSRHSRSDAFRNCLKRARVSICL